MKTILVIDDDIFVHNCVEDICRRTGAYNLIVADSSRTAEAALAQGTMDVVLLDVLLPDVDSFELLPKIRARCPVARIITMSGGVFSDKFPFILRATESLGAHQSLQKPFTAERLLAVIEGNQAEKELSA